MSEHRYQRQAIYLDYGRAGLGFSVTFGPLLFLDLMPALAWPFGLLGLLFLWFGVRTGIRHASAVRITPEQIELAGPKAKTIPWRDLQDVRLAYFSPRRARSDGWLQLTLRGRDRGALKVDSTLERFDDVLERVQDAALANQLSLEPVTAANFAALGLEPDAPGELADDQGVTLAPPSSDPLRRG